MYLYSLLVLPTRASFPFEKGRDILGLQPSESDFHQRSTYHSHHVVEESVTFRHNRNDRVGLCSVAIDTTYTSYINRIDRFDSTYFQSSHSL